MKINKKLLIIIFFILIVTLIAIKKSYFEYSLNKVVDLIDKSDEIPENIYIQGEIVYELTMNPDEKIVYEIYAKDDIIYEKYGTSHNEEITYTQELILNYKNKSEIDIYCYDESKKIIVRPIQGNGKRNPLTEILIGLSRELKSTQGKYKYWGKEEVNGKECIKCSVTTDESEGYYYYVDVKDNTVVKQEYYRKGGALNSTHLYTYSYGTVTDDDILNFDINNYPDYEYEEWDF